MWVHESMIIVYESARVYDYGAVHESMIIVQCTRVWL